MTAIRIFHCNIRESYDPEPLARTLVWEGDLAGYGGGTNDFDYCEGAFAAFNRGSGQEHPDLNRLGLRSLSVGDAVQIVEPGNSRFYKCVSAGWEPIEGVRGSVVSIGADGIVRPTASTQ